MAENDEISEIKVVVLNLDTPALNEELQLGTYRIIDIVLGKSRPIDHRDTSTILLTHFPLHKEAGICVDSPYFDFQSGVDGRGVKEQNHLNYRACKGIL